MKLTSFLGFSETPSRIRLSLHRLLLLQPSLLSFFVINDRDFHTSPPPSILRSYLQLPQQGPLRSLQCQRRFRRSENDDDDDDGDGRRQDGDGGEEWSQEGFEATLSEEGPEERGSFLCSLCSAFFSR